MIRIRFSKSMEYAFLQLMIVASILAGILFAFLLGKGMQELVVSYAKAFLSKLTMNELATSQEIVATVLKRGSILLVCIFAMTKWKVKWPTILMLVWYFVCAGFVGASLIENMGVVGAKVLAAMTLPQCVFYTIFAKLIIRRCEKEADCYFVKRKRELLLDWMMFVLVVVIILVNECYVNSFMLKFFLKNYLT